MLLHCVLAMAMRWRDNRVFSPPSPSPSPSPSSPSHHLSVLTGDVRINQTPRSVKPFYRDCTVRAPPLPPIDSRATRAEVCYICKCVWVWVTKKCVNCGSSLSSRATKMMIFYSFLFSASPTLWWISFFDQKQLSSAHSRLLLRYCPMCKALYKLNYNIPV